MGNMIHEMMAARDVKPYRPKETLEELALSSVNMAAIRAEHERHKAGVVGENLKIRNRYRIDIDIDIDIEARAIEARAVAKSSKLNRRDPDRIRQLAAGIAKLTAELQIESAKQS